MNGRVGAVVLGVVLVICLIFVFMSLERIPVGYEGVVFNMDGGVEDETLTQGFHFIAPWKRVSEFTIGNEQLILTKDSREGSENDESFKVSTSDDASIAISFQMSYRFKPDTLIDTYKKFKGMQGEDIVNNRLRTVLKSKVSEITTSYSMMDIYSGNRAEINKKLTEYLGTAFVESFGIEVIDASIVDVHPDEKLKTAIDNRVTALQQKQQAQAEQEKVKVEAETAKINAKKDAEVKTINAEADAKVKKINAEAEASSNKTISKSLTRNLIDMKLAEARVKHGWVTTQGASAVVTKK